MQRIKLYLNSLQTLALIFSLQFAWPETTYGYSQWIFPVVLFGLSDSIFPTCLMGSWTWAHGFIVQACTIPLAYLLVLGVEMRIAFSRSGVDGDDGNEEEGRQMRRSKAWGFFLTYIDISYVAVVLMSFQALTCREESDGNAYLIVAPDVQCHHGIHLLIKPLADVGVYVYGIGCESCIEQASNHNSSPTHPPTHQLTHQLRHFFSRANCNHHATKKQTLST